MVQERNFAGKVALAVLLVALAGLWAARLFAAAEQGPPTEILQRLLKAVERNDFDTYASYGTSSFTQESAKEVLENMSRQLGGRLAKGYVTSYLGVVKQKGGEYHLWRIMYKDNADDSLAKIFVKNKKVEGFWLQ